MASLRPEDIDVICELGSPGEERSAEFSPLNECDIIDVGEIIEDEIAGYIDMNYYIVVDSGVPVWFNGRQVVVRREEYEYNRI